MPMAGHGVRPGWGGQELGFPALFPPATSLQPGALGTEHPPLPALPTGHSPLEPGPFFLWERGAQPPLPPAPQTSSMCLWPWQFLRGVQTRSSAWSGLSQLILLVGIGGGGGGGRLEATQEAPGPQASAPAMGPKCTPHGSRLGNKMRPGRRVGEGWWGEGEPAWAGIGVGPVLEKHLPLRALPAFAPTWGWTWTPVPCLLQCCRLLPSGHAGPGGQCPRPGPFLTPVTEGISLLRPVPRFPFRTAQDLGFASAAGAGQWLTPARCLGNVARPAIYSGGRQGSESRDTLIYTTDGL